MFVAICICKSTCLKLHRQNFFKISVVLALQNGDVSVVDVMIFFIIEDFLLRERIWYKHRVLGSGNCSN